MMSTTIRVKSSIHAVVISLAIASMSPGADVPQLDRSKLPGRQVKVAAICIGFGGQHDEKLKLALDHLHTAGKNGVDIACLPEEFSGTQAEPIPGPLRRPWRNWRSSTTCTWSARSGSRPETDSTTRPS